MKENINFENLIANRIKEKFINCPKSLSEQIISESREVVEEMFYYGVINEAEQHFLMTCVETYANTYFNLVNI